MFNSVAEVKQFIAEKHIEMIDFKMVDLEGRWRHLSIPAERFTEKTMTDGIGFDGSNYGFAPVEKSDMVFIPDIATAMIDPFCAVKTLSICGNAMIIDDPENRPLPQYPRNITLAAAQYLKDSGIADTMKILPEFEFYLFDEAGWKLEGKGQEAHVDFAQSHWNSDSEGKGNVVPFQKNYHIAKPYDTSYECRSEMVLNIEEAGIPVNYHHPEVSASGQFEIEPQLGELVKMADATVMIKYIIKNTAMKYGKCATFMPKPVYGEAGSGMHVHMLLLKDGKPVFYDENGYSRLSKTAHYFMGGLLKHIDSLCALCNPSTNSYKRLIPGFEAPVTVGYATSNRSAVIRIPAYVKEPAMRRFELRNPDATCNPYLCFAAILMAGIDGIVNRIDPKDYNWGPFDFNLYHLSEEEKAKLEHLPASLDEAIDALKEDHEYLLAGNVFSKELLNNWIRSVKNDVDEVNKIPHPAEFRLYYDL